MPEFLGKTSQANHGAPQEQRYAEPDGAPTIVGQKPGKESRQGVQVVEHGSRHDLVGETTPTVGVLTDVFSLVEGAVDLLGELQDGKVLTEVPVPPGNKQNYFNAP